VYRIGIVVAVDEKKAIARVRWTDIDGEVSYWLPIMQKKTLKDKEYWLPDINEHVVCLIDENAEEGVILGAIYSDADAPPVQDKNKYHIKFEDGTTIEYDKSEHKLKANVKGDIDVKATGRADIDIQGQIYIKSATNVTIQAPIINMKGGSPAEGYFEGNFRLIGNLYVQGNIHATGSIIDDGGNTNHHTH